MLYNPIAHGLEIVLREWGASATGTRGRCYDHNFLQFLPIFGEKIVVFLKNQCYDQSLAKTGCSLSKKRQHFRQMFWRKYLKNDNIGPRSWCPAPGIK
jgi:hypothetical protein